MNSKCKSIIISSLLVYILYVLAVILTYSNISDNMFLDEPLVKLSNPNEFNSDNIFDELSAIDNFNKFSLNSLKLYEDTGVQFYYLSREIKDNVDTYTATKILLNAAENNINDDYAIALCRGEGKNISCEAMYYGEVIGKLLDSNARANIMDSFMMFKGINIGYDNVCSFIEYLDSGLTNNVDIPKLKAYCIISIAVGLLCTVLVDVVSCFRIKKGKEETDISILRTPIDDLVAKYLEDRDEE